MHKDLACIPSTTINKNNKKPFEFNRGGEVSGRRQKEEGWYMSWVLSGVADV